VTIALSPDGTGSRADVVTDLAVTGKPAQFGRGVMQDVSDKLLQAFVACIEKQLGGVDDAAEPASVAVAPAASVASGAASGVADAAGEATVADVSAEPLTTVGATPARVADAPTAAAPAATRSSPSGQPRRVTSAVEEDDALDLGSAVMPVLIKRYAGYAGAALVGLAIGVLIGRRAD
ncbi:MAG: carbon monoxide dehydrogenase, partial [Humibacillus sp.]